MESTLSTIVRGAMLAACALAWACGSDPGGADAGSSDAGTGGTDAGLKIYQPLAIGDRWIYHVVDTSAGVAGTQTISVDAYEAVGGMKPAVMAFKFHKTKVTGGSSDSWYQDQVSAVVIHHDVNLNSAGMKSDEEWYEPYRIRVDQTPEHTQAGATWIETIHKTNIDVVTGTVISNERVTWVVESATATVTVGTEHLTAIRLRREAGTSPKRYWFVEGIGKVRESGGQEEELLSYTVR